MHEVVLSDEKKFNWDDAGGFSYHWHYIREEEEILSIRAQGGGNPMIWAFFHWGGKSSICFEDERVNSNGYQEVLKKYTIDISNSMGGSDWSFQQENAPLHRAKVNLT